MLNDYSAPNRSILKMICMFEAKKCPIIDLIDFGPGFLEKIRKKISLEFEGFFGIRIEE